MNYYLKFHQLSRYGPELVSSVRTRIRKFASGLSHDFILQSKVSLFIKDMDIFILILYMKLVQKEKKKYAEMSERNNRKFCYLDQGRGQQWNDRDGEKWSKKKWGSFDSYSMDGEPYPKQLGDCYWQYNTRFRALGFQPQASGAKLAPLYPPCRFCGQVHHGVYEKQRN